MSSISGKINKDFYLRVGSARDFKNRKDYWLYRALEMLPGILMWSTFLGVVAASLFFPFFAAIFIVLFDLYWLLKAVYFSLHLRTSFKKMREYSVIDWLNKLDGLNLSGHELGVRDWRKDMWHLVIIPYYKEGEDVIRNTIIGLLNTHYSKDRFIVVLSGEERSGDKGKEIGQTVAQEFGSRFGKFFLTFHPDKAGEVAGKGANETWAALQVKEKIIDPLKIPYENIIVSVFDADTVPAVNYFSRLTYVYLTTDKPLRKSYQPIPLFVNNIWEAPALARVIAFSSTFWHMMNQVRPERLTSFSSQSFPFKALVDLGFWQTNVVSEDSRIFWQGVLGFDGDWQVEPLLVPVSMDANVAESFWATMKNLYLQQRRWAYGSENIPYFLYGFLKNKNISRRMKFYWVFNILESFWSWATNSIIIFLMGWLPLLLGGKEFDVTILAYNTPRFTRVILTLAMFGIVSSVYLSLLLLPPRPVVYGRHKYLYMVAQWALIPLTLIFFGSIPAIDAETRLMFGKYLGFWPTPKIRKGVQKNF